MTLNGLSIAIAFSALLTCQAQAAESVRVCTSLGAFTIELVDEAPLHTNNMLALVEDGYYNGLIFHRAIEGRLAQAGGYDRRFRTRPQGDPIPNESDNGLTNERGTVAAARLRDADSARAQFFVNLADNDEFDPSGRRAGFTVFGRVTAGLDVADAIAALPTGGNGPLSDDVPSPLVVIESMSRLPAPAADAPVVSDAGPGTAAPDGTAEPVSAGAATSLAAEELLDRIDRMRNDCAPIPPALLIDEAEAAIAGGANRRARFALDDYFGRVDADAPLVPRAQALFRQLPPEEQTNVSALLAHCPGEPAPDLPDGRRATLTEMETAQADVRRYLASMDGYLECLSDVIDGGALSDVQEVAAVSMHNQTVTAMESMAEAFNRELRAYRSAN